MTDLAELGRRRRQGLRDREAIDAQIALSVRAALNDGRTMSHCAEVVGLSRQGLYDLLRRYPKGTE